MRLYSTSPAPGGRIQVNIPWGAKVADNSDHADRICMEADAEFERRTRRPPSKQERLYGPKAADDRTPEQVAERKAWRPKRPQPDAMTALADSLESGTDQPDYRGLTLRQRLAADARRISERNQSDAETDSQQAEKLNRLKHDLKKIDDAITAENWRTENGSQRVVDLLECLRSQLVDGSDAQETRRLRGEVQQLLAERAKQESAAQRAAIAALEQQIATVRDGSQLGNVGESDPIRYRAEQLMAEGADSTSAWTTARAEAN